MKRLILLAALIFVSFSIAQEYRLGSKIDEFSVRDLNGKPLMFSQFKGYTTVLVFIANQCPVCNGYVERMNSLYADFIRRQVHFIFINANATELADSVAAHAKDYAFAFPVYKDEGNIVADKFGAHTTPETFVIDTTGTLRYRGPIDDSRDPGRIHNQWLRNALEAVITGKPVEKAEIKVFGCSIQRAKP